MRSGVHVFILTLCLFVAGTTTIGYTFAQTPYSKPTPRKPEQLITTLNISTMICNAYYEYETTCEINFNDNMACEPFENFISPLHVPHEKITQTQVDAVTYCKLLYPKN